MQYSEHNMDSLWLTLTVNMFCGLRNYTKPVYEFMCVVSDNDSKDYCFALLWQEQSKYCRTKLAIYLASLGDNLATKRGVDKKAATESAQQPSSINVFKKHFIIFQFGLHCIATYFHLLNAKIISDQLSKFAQLAIVCVRCAQPAYLLN